MESKKVRLVLTQAVSKVMLADIRALVPPQALNVFVNALDAHHYATLDCSQSPDTCALLASAIVVWRQLGHVHHIDYQKGDVVRDVSDASQFQLFTLLKTHRAVLQLA